jgi:hypothetical protein
MNGQCKDCRFFNGKNCAINGGVKTPNSGCGYWVSNSASSTVKQCRACRFYDGKKCSTQGTKTPNSGCGNWAAYR